MGKKLGNRDNAAKREVFGCQQRVFLLISHSHVRWMLCCAAFIFLTFVVFGAANSKKCFFDWSKFVLLFASFLLRCVLYFRKF